MKRLLVYPKWKAGFLLAGIEVAYVMLVALFIVGGPPGAHLLRDIPEALIGTMILLLLVVSVAVSGAVVLGVPLYLAIEHRWQEAARLLAWILGWITVLVALLVLIAVVAR